MVQFWTWWAGASGGNVKEIAGVSLESRRQVWAACTKKIWESSAWRLKLKIWDQIKSLKERTKRESNLAFPHSPALLDFQSISFLGQLSLWLPLINQLINKLKKFNDYFQIWDFICISLCFSVLLSNLMQMKMSAISNTVPSSKSYSLMTTPVLQQGSQYCGPHDHSSQLFICICSNYQAPS